MRVNKIQHLQCSEMSNKNNPSSFWLNFELGKSLSELGESNQAVEYLRAALAVRPDSLEVVMSLCTALRESGRIDESHQVQEVMIRQIPQGQENRHALHAIYLKLRKEGRVPSIIAAKRSYCDANPDDADRVDFSRAIFFAAARQRR